MSYAYSQQATYPGVIGTLGDESFLCKAFTQIATVCLTESTFPVKIRGTAGVLLIGPVPVVAAVAHQQVGAARRALSALPTLHYEVALLLRCRRRSIRTDARHIRYNRRVRIQLHSTAGGVMMLMRRQMLDWLTQCRCRMESCRRAKSAAPFVLTPSNRQPSNCSRHHH